MKIFPHPQAALDKFKVFVQRSLNAENKLLTIKCSSPEAFDADNSSDYCIQSNQFNSQIDIGVQGDLQGQLLNFPYNRINLATIVTGKNGENVYLQGNKVRLIDLLGEINVNNGTSILAYDIIDQPIPYTDFCCGDYQKVQIFASPDSLLYYGSFEIYIRNEDMELNDVLNHPFLSPNE